MGFLIFWLGTSIASIVMEFSNELRMFKDVADAGYKIDVKRLSELSKQLNPDASKATLLSMLIPIFNIMHVLQRTIQYNNVRGMVLDQLNVMDALEEMSEIEKQEYLKKPTGLNALLVPLKNEVKVSRALSIEYDEGNEKSKIYFEMGKNFDDIIILKVTGPASKLTIEEQKEKVNEIHKKLAEGIIRKFGDKDSFLTAMKNNENIELNLDSELDDKNEVIDSSVQNSNVSEQKEMLQNLKNEILEERQKIQESNVENAPTLSKRKK